MSKMSREEKLFRNENNVLEYYKRVTTDQNSLDETRDALNKLTHKYESLLNQTRFLTWISGRLERKLLRKNNELQDNNLVLLKTLAELTKAEAGKSAYAIIYSIAIALFVLEEFFVDPIVSALGGMVGYSILFKLLIVLSLKMSEGFIENKIARNRQRTNQRP